MAYATVEAVQQRVPMPLWEPTPASQPTLGVVSAWLDADSAFVDGALAWKYVVPVTSTDRDLLSQIVADLTAARVWAVLGSYSPDQPNPVRTFREGALLSLGYDVKTRQAHIVLPNTPLSDTGEAAVDAPVSTFTDPNAEGSNPRFFTIRQEF